MPNHPTLRIRSAIHSEVRPGPNDQVTPDGVRNSAEAITTGEAIVTGTRSPFLDRDPRVWPDRSLYAEIQRLNLLKTSPSRYRKTHRPEKNVTDQGSEPRASDVPLASDSEVTLERGHLGDARIVVIPLSGLCTLCRAPIGAWARTGYLRSESKIRIDQRHSHRVHRK